MRHHLLNSLTSRRDFLQRAGLGCGSLALTSLLHQEGVVAATPSATNPLAARPAQFTPKAKAIIWLFQTGSPSQVDTFDYKPRLAKDDGKLLEFDDARTLAKTKQITTHRVFKSPWRFRQYGRSGQHVSELFPHIAGHVDDLCFLKGMHTDGVAHGPSTLFLHTGSINLIRPSMRSCILWNFGKNRPGRFPRNWCSIPA